MARPKKANIDYFPHDCKHGKTMFILEGKYGNDGYAFWFKLLEMLGDTEGHVIDCSNAIAWEFLQSKTRLDSHICDEILSLLAKLGAIDDELWQEKIIWSENFVARIADVYRNRRVEIPRKPSFYTPKPLADDISTPDNTQSKSKSKSKVKEEVYAQPENPVDANPPVYTCQHFDISPEYFETLLNDYPGLTEDLLLMEIKKAADYATDNNGRFKRTSAGQLKNPRLFLRNWLSKVIIPQESAPRAPTGKQKTSGFAAGMEALALWNERKERQDAE